MRHPDRPMDGRGTRADRGLSRFGPRRWRSSGALLVLSAAVALVAGCGAGGPSTRPTTPTPPDRLAVTLSGAGVPAIRFDLECAVADHDACVAVVAALEKAQSDDHCAPAPDGRGAAIDVTGTLGGDAVDQRIDRSTDCQVRAYEAITAGLGL